MLHCSKITVEQRSGPTASDERVLFHDLLPRRTILPTRIRYRTGKTFWNERDWKRFRHLVSRSLIYLSHYNDNSLLPLNESSFRRRLFKKYEEIIRSLRGWQKFRSFTSHVRSTIVRLPQAVSKIFIGILSLWNTDPFSVRSINRDHRESARVKIFFPSVKDVAIVNEVVIQVIESGAAPWNR